MKTKLLMLVFMATMALSLSSCFVEAPHRGGYYPHNRFHGGGYYRGGGGHHHGGGHYGGHYGRY